MDDAMTEITEDLIREYVAHASEASDRCREQLVPEETSRIGYMILHWLVDSLYVLATSGSFGGVPDPRIAALCRYALPKYEDLSDQDRGVTAEALFLVRMHGDAMRRSVHRTIRKEMSDLLDLDLAYPPGGLSRRALMDLYSLGILLSVMADVEDARGSCEDPPSE